AAERSPGAARGGGIRDLRNPVTDRRSVASPRAGAAGERISRGCLAPRSGWRGTANPGPDGRGRTAPELNPQCSLGVSAEPGERARRVEVRQHAVVEVEAGLRQREGVARVLDEAAADQALERLAVVPLDRRAERALVGRAGQDLALAERAG